MKFYVFVIAFAACAFAQDSTAPITFRKAYIGQPAAELVDCSGKPRALLDGYKPHGKICEGGKGSIARLRVAWSKRGTEGEIFSIEDNRVTKIVLYYNSDWDWEKVASDITEKLGEPVSDVPDVYQNGFGARWEFGKGFWQKGEIVAFAGERVAMILGRPEPQGIQVTITDAKHAKLRYDAKNSLD